MGCDGNPCWTQEDRDKLNNIHELLTNRHVGAFVRLERLEKRFMGDPDNPNQPGFMATMEARMTAQENESKQVRWWMGKIMVAASALATFVVSVGPYILKEFKLWIKNL